LGITLLEDTIAQLKENLELDDLTITGAIATLYDHTRVAKDTLDALGMHFGDRLLRASFHETRMSRRRIATRSASSSTPRRARQLKRTLPSQRRSSAMSGRKTTGLAHNPLLARTDTTDEPATASGARATPDQTGTQLPAEDVTHEHVDTSTGIQVNSQAGTHADTSTRILDRSLKFTFYFSEEQLDRLDHVWKCYGARAGDHGGASANRSSCASRSTTCSTSLRKTRIR
jgi:hypothetical protein